MNRAEQYLEMCYAELNYRLDQFFANPSKYRREKMEQAEADYHRAWCLLYNPQGLSV